MENTVNRLGEMHKLESINTAQKRTITILAIVISAIIAISILYFFFGDPQLFKKTT
mgnify:FL=1|jgi:hypothetical protein